MLGHRIFELDDSQLTACGYDRDSLQAEINDRRWYHSFDFGGGLMTPGRDDADKKLKAFELPDLAGKTVIDIGSYDGYYAFEAEQRGASKVVASDHWAWTWPGEDARRNFDLVHSVLGSKVEPLQVPVEELDGDEHGTYDVTLFLGVLYHAPDMMQYLRAVRSVTKEMLIVETLVDALDDKRPVAVFYPRGTIPGDDSNYWGPNPACVEEMLYRAGFSKVSRRSLYQEQQLADLGARKRTRRAVDGRMVFHAWV